VVESTAVGRRIEISRPRFPLSTREGAIVNPNHATATFGAGCFWGVEQAFRQLDGVVDTAVGYTGGHTERPTYRDVCTGTTGHAEAVQITFDPSRISYEQLLDAFWSLHDPTQVNRQGPDVGSQYRSVIFVHNPRQEDAARASRSALDASDSLSRPVATEIEPAGPFWRAEEYHQQYLAKRGMGSCHVPG
jgi:peptide-methionine (S)-S-oxide reductase